MKFATFILWVAVAGLLAWQAADVVVVTYENAVEIRQEVLE